jgi:sulfonate transport system ATP-binding protein
MAKRNIAMVDRLILRKKGDPPPREETPVCLAARNITRVFTDNDGNEIVALERFDLEIRAGEIVALIGPSGCGKSTFLRLAAGLDSPQNGEMTYNGRPIAGPRYERGFVFQDANLFPWLTVEGNIAFGLKARGVYQEERGHIQEYIDLVGLSGFEKSYPHQISGGMASRAALARTFIQRPGLILLDEPLSALDAFTRAGVQGEILRIWARDRPTILLVTHDIEEAVYMCSRVVVLSPRPGRVLGEAAIPMAHPRDRMDEEFVLLRREIMNMLKF